MSDYGVEDVTCSHEQGDCKFAPFEVPVSVIAPATCSYSRIEKSPAPSTCGRTGRESGSVNGDIFHLHASPRSW